MNTMELKRLEEEEHSSSDFVSLAIQDDAALSFVYEDCFAALMPVIVPFEAIFGSEGDNPRQCLYDQR